MPVISISGPDLAEVFAGIGAAHMRDLFEEAQKASPCIIFTGELDALGRGRAGAGSLGGFDEKEKS